MHCSGRLWQVLLQLQAEGASETLQGQAQLATQQLAAACSLPGAQALAALHAPDLLGGLASKVRVLVTMWETFRLQECSLPLQQDAAQVSASQVPSLSRCRCSSWLPQRAKSCPWVVPNAKGWLAACRTQHPGRLGSPTTAFLRRWYSRCPPRRCSSCSLSSRPSCMSASQTLKGAPGCLGLQGDLHGSHPQKDSAAGAGERPLHPECTAALPGACMTSSFFNLPDLS